MSRYDVFLVSLDPTQGHEMQKTRPCVVISPDELNRHVRTVIIAPMTTASREYPFRVVTRFADQEGQIALDQMRCIDQARLIRKLGTIDPPTREFLHEAIEQMFAP